MEEKRIVEINGVKLEVDLRHATHVDQFKVGDKVKLLMPSGYSESKHEVYPGVIVGFEPFEALPTIVIAYFKIEYGSAKLKFAYLNAETEKIEIVKADNSYLPIEKDHVVESFEGEIIKKRAELEETIRKRDYFLNHFNMCFKEEEGGDKSLGVKAR